MQPDQFERSGWRGTAIAVLAMVVVVTASNVLVQYPINDWLTWGAFTYPFAFLVTDLTNRRFGPARARWVAYAGFVFAVGLSWYLATPRIAVASGLTFLAAQLTDIFVFGRLRDRRWWQAPLVSSSVASLLDTVMFFSIAFWGSGLPWVTWAIGDFAVKLGMALVMLIPFWALLRPTRPR